ncbi:MAG: SUMF1/EgtB/PvdO family nonheme iron enzyme, partial [Pirellulales bacterium]|nr:SUMF1/EgtB/PvdO family nonheme iron enzyme [Pirellulales bacterium]
DRIDPTRDDAIVYLSDIYAGEGLKDIPRGTVKKLRLVSYHFLYPGMGGPQGVVGMEGPWDIKRILGTVQVEADGSAVFRVPANTPIAIQPLDEEGKALQLMRSWFTAMPGEVVSCVGCHESQNTVPPTKFTAAAYRSQPVEIDDWYGPARGFNFRREVQPVLDKYCVGCHNGQSQKDGSVAFDLRGLENITDYKSTFHFGGKDAGHFSTSYAELHRYVRRPGLESDYHMLTPMEFHADTTQLIQMLKKGHHGVELDREAWDRLITWIDLNAPFHGTWTEIAGKERVEHPARRRRELLKQYAGMDFDPEKIVNPVKSKVEPTAPRKTPAAKPDENIHKCSTWPFDAEEARRRRTALGPESKTIELGDGQKLEMILIPPGEFIMGDENGQRDERPASLVSINKPFWMARLEVTNSQYTMFDPMHDSRVESKHAMQFGVRGFYVNKPQQPVVRVSWENAMDFCRWLSRKTGKAFTLPTEAQWEYACRAGSDTDFNFGPRGTDFSRHANLADITLREFVCHPYKKQREPHKHATKYDDWIPRNNLFNDGGFVSEAGGRYEPNAWGLFDMHGNVSEWTRSAYRPYPYREDDGRNNLASDENRVARGGSWRDRPLRARSAFRLEYKPYQRVYNVGFRVVCPAE